MSLATDGFSAIIKAFPMCLVLLQRNNRRFTEADGYSLSVGKLAQKPENVNRPDKNGIFLRRKFSSNGFLLTAGNSRFGAAPDEFGTVFHHGADRRYSSGAREMLLTSTNFASPAQHAFHKILL